MLRLGRGLFVGLAGLCGFFGAALTPLGAPDSDVAAPVLKQPASPQAVKIRSLSLPPGRSLTKALAVAEIHRYPVSLKPGEALLVRVEQALPGQTAVDVRISFLDPAGRLLYRVDHLRDMKDPEVAHLISKSRGAYLVDISASGTGTYRIEIQTRPARPSDRLEAQAEEAYDRAKLHRSWQELRSASEIWRRAGDRVRQTDALQKALDFITPDMDAQSLSRQVADLRHELDDAENEAKAVLYLGTALQKSGDLKGAEKAFRKAMQLTERRFPDTAGAAARDLYFLMQQKGERYRGLDFLDRAEHLHEKSGNKDEQWKTLEGAGRAYMSFGEASKALEYFQKCLRLAETMGRRDYEATSLARMGDVSQTVRDWKAALYYYQLARSRRHEIGDGRGEAVIVGSMSTVYRELGAPREALRLQQEALSVYRLSGDLANENAAYCHLGLIQIDLRDPLQAIRFLDRCGELAKARGDRELMINSFYGQAQAQRDQKNPRLALLSIQRALKLIEDVRPTDGIDNSAVKIRMYSYELLIDLLVEASRMREAFEASEAARWRSLLDSLGPEPRAIRLLRNEAPDLESRRDQIIKEIENLETRINRQGEDSPRSKRLKELRTAASLELRSLQSRIQARAVGAKSLTMREAQQLLDADTAVLEFFLGQRRSFLFYLTSSNLEVFVLPGRSSLEEASNDYYRKISASPLASNAVRVRPAASRVSDLLLAPLGDRLAEKKRLIVVPDGAIHHVAFGALPWRSNGKSADLLLIEKEEIAKAPSLSVLQAVRLQSKIRNASLFDIAVIAAPELGADSQPLPNSRWEGEEVRALFQRERTWAAFGSDASRKLLLEERLSRSRFILFSTHWEDHPEQPELSSLAVSGRGEDGRPITDRIWLQDIRELNLSTELVVLSACRTALGTDVPGEGALGLPQAFLSAGASRVAVTLWDVNDKASAVLTVGLFRGIVKDKLSPAQALRQAQLAMKNSKEWSSPYYWAPFELYGEWR